MPRITFDGKGDPVPSLALPAVGSDDNVAPTVLTFTESTDFPVADYRALGFTHYEVAVVGAAGGRGGDSSSQKFWVQERVSTPVPQYIWDLVRERAVLADYLIQASMYHAPAETLPPGGVNGPGISPTGPYRDYAVPPEMNKVYKAWKYPVFTPGENCWFTDIRDDTVDPAYLRWRDIVEGEFHKQLAVSSSSQTSQTPYWDGQRWWGFTEWTFSQVRYVDLFEAAHPNHLMTFVTFKEMLLVSTIEGMGGAGGGGGMQKTAGALEDLPDTVSIMVGEAGADAPYGQVVQNGMWTPGLADISLSDKAVSVPGPFLGGLPYIGSGVYDAQLGRIAEIEAYLKDYIISYPEPHSSFSNPVKGQDGGTTSFGTVAEASGGVGGEPGMVWDAPTNKFKIKGHGGAGGLGDRSEAGGGGAGSVAEGVNGADGTWIPETGIGGGGGGGKGGNPPTGGGFDPRTGALISPLVRHDATAGGQGSFSFADTSVYGQRQFRQPWSYLRITGGYPVGPVVLTPVVSQSNLVTPGGGGGARPLTNLKVGSRATGYSPDGVVVLRLVTITE